MSNTTKTYAVEIMTGPNAGICADRFRFRADAEDRGRWDYQNADAAARLAGTWFKGYSWRVVEVA